MRLSNRPSERTDKAIPASRNLLKYSQDHVDVDLEKIIQGDGVARIDSNRSASKCGCRTSPTFA